MRADGSSTGVDEEGSLYAFGIERIGLSADFGQQHVEIWGFQVTLVLPCSRYVVYIYIWYMWYILVCIYHQSIAISMEHWDKPLDFGPVLCENAQHFFRAKQNADSHRLLYT